MVNTKQNTVLCISKIKQRRKTKQKQKINSVKWSGYLTWKTLFLFRIEKKINFTFTMSSDNNFVIELFISDLIVQLFFLPRNQYP